MAKAVRTRRRPELSTLQLQRLDAHLNRLTPSAPWRDVCAVAVHHGRAKYRPDFGAQAKSLRQAGVFPPAADYPLSEMVACHSRTCGGHRLFPAAYCRGGLLLINDRGRRVLRWLKRRRPGPDAPDDARRAHADRARRVRRLMLRDSRYHDRLPLCDDCRHAIKAARLERLIRRRDELAADRAEREQQAAEQSPAVAARDLIKFYGAAPEESDLKTESAAVLAKQIERYKAGKPTELAPNPPPASVSKFVDELAAKRQRKQYGARRAIVVDMSQGQARDD